jgi:hypothetical protein
VWAVPELYGVTSQKTELFGITELETNRKNMSTGDLHTVHIHSREYFKSIINLFLESSLSPFPLIESKYLTLT